MNDHIPEECECCGTPAGPAIVLKSYEAHAEGLPAMKTEKVWYCELCAGTLTSNFSRYPSQQPSGFEIMRTVCYVGNAIIAALQEKK